MRPNLKDTKYFGTVTVGKRGQIVIPAEARNFYEINPGSKLLVFGNEKGLGITKASILEKIFGDFFKDFSFSIQDQNNNEGKKKNGQSS
ncbi:MAG: AbrB/MazE/SpoVT family DNA-binding domain-containing protein [Promethearchaeota archaeon]